MVVINYYLTMAFYQKTGHRQGESYSVAASTTISVGGVLAFDGNGKVYPATSTTTHFVMIAGKNKKSTDSDYASVTQVEGAMLNPSAEFECDNISGTATAGMVGKSYDLLDCQTLNVSGQSVRVFTVTKFVSASKVWGRFNASYLVTGGLATTL